MVEDIIWGTIIKMLVVAKVKYHPKDSISIPIMEDLEVGEVLTNLEVVWDFTETQFIK